MAWDVVWQSNRAWPTDTGIYFYEVDKQAPKLNIQYAPHLIFKILLKKNHIHTHTNIYMYVNTYFILYLYKKSEKISTQWCAWAIIHMAQENWQLNFQQLCKPVVKYSRY